MTMHRDGANGDAHRDAMRNDRRDPANRFASYAAGTDHDALRYPHDPGNRAVFDAAETGHDVRADHVPHVHARCRHRTHPRTHAHIQYPQWTMSVGPRLAGHAEAPAARCNANVHWGRRSGMLGLQCEGDLGNRREARCCRRRLLDDDHRCRVVVLVAVLASACTVSRQ